MRSIAMWTILLTAMTGQAVAGQAPIRFVDEAERAGVTDVAVNSTGPTFVDYDLDGDIDIFVPTEAHLDGHGNRLYENDGRGQFTDVAVERRVDNGRGLARGASWGDIDNDGDMDMIVANMPTTDRRAKQIPHTAYKNLLVETGQPNFEEITVTAGLLREGHEKDALIGGISDTGAGVAWGDYDSDGFLDLYVKLPDYDVDNVLFRNNGDGTFSDVTGPSGTGVLDKVMKANAQGSPNWTDFNQDGRLDLLVTNEGEQNLAFLNNGDGTFADITRNRKPPRALALLNPGNANGACIGDIDNDSDMDIFLPTADQANRLVISQFADKGDVRFKDITSTSGIGDMGGARGCVMADYDNDGWLDIYVNNGGDSNVLINDVIRMPVFVQFYIAWEPAYNKLYRNNGDNTFTDVTDGSGAEGFGIGSGVGAADINDDGYPDLFVTNRTYYSMGKRVGIEQQNQLLINSGGDNHWVRVALVGTKSNRSGYGARVKLVSGELVQYREHTSAHGYNSANDPRLLFGLGQKASIDYIEVTWPSGIVQKVDGAKPGTTVTIIESDQVESELSEAG
jgi:enediyne biosynthesis protein E4